MQAAESVRGGGRATAVDPPDLRGGLRVIPPAEDVLPRSQAGGDQHIVDDLKVVRAI